MFHKTGLLTEVQVPSTTQFYEAYDCDIHIYTLEPVNITDIFYIQALGSYKNRANYLPRFPIGCLTITQNVVFREVLQLTKWINDIQTYTVVFVLYT